MESPLTDDLKLPGVAAGDALVPASLPTVIGVRGARQNNLQDVDVDVPLWRTVAVVGVSGSGKTSLAIGTLYAEGLQRLLEGLSTYSRRRLTQARRPDVDRSTTSRAALALRQRPPIPGPRSTVGTMSEVLNVLRLMMSRLGSHLCPNGHRVGPVSRHVRRGDRVPGVRRTFRAPERRIIRVQLLRRLPRLPGPRRTLRSRRQHPGPRPGQDDRGRRGAAVELWRATAVDVRGTRARGPARRAVPVAHRARARHRPARRTGPAAGDAAFGPDRADRATLRQLRQRRRRGGALAAQRQRAFAPAGAAFPRHPRLLGVPRHPAAARGTHLTARRPQHRRDQRPRPRRAAGVRGQFAAPGCPPSSAG